MLVRAVGASVTVMFATACSSALRASGGPVAAPMKNDAPAYGAEVLAGASAGVGNSDNVLAMDAVGRAHATERSQALDLGLGTAWFGTFGRGLVFGDLTPMAGVERFDGEILSLGTLRAGFGGGVVLRESTTLSQGFLWNKVETQKTALTIELTGNTDFPFNRGPHYSFGLLAGVAWINFVE